MFRKRGLCLSPSLWLSIKLDHEQRQEGRRGPRTASVMGAGLGALGSGWVEAEEMVPPSSRSGLPAGKFILYIKEETTMRPSPGCMREIYQ